MDRHAILSALARATGTAALGDTTVRIQELSLTDRLLADERGRAGIGGWDRSLQLAVVIARGVIDAGGARVFSDDDIGAIAEMRWESIRALGEAILALSEARPGDMKSMDRAPDAGEPHAEGGAAGD